MVHYRYAHDDSGIQRRYFEFRFDADERRISGVAMRYGDVAKLPWGEKERFEPGAFGEVGGLDVLLNVQHDRSQPIARTTGGTMRLTDSAGELRIEADLPDTTIANDAVANIRAGILRGFSVEFLPEETRQDGDTIVVEKAKLRGVGVVDRPAYPKSRLLPRSEDDMKPEEIKALIERSVAEALSKRAEGDPVDPAAIATAVSAAIAEPLAAMPTAESMRAEIDAALKARDDAEAAAEKERAEKAAMKKKADDEEEMMKKKADDRADLLLTVKPLLAEGTETRGMSNHELLVAAVGDEVTDAANRSEDYLLAKVEAIAERRAAAASGNPKPVKPGASGAAGSNPVNMTRFIEQRNAARRTATA